MAHRQTECHREGPRGTIVHDEHHVLEALSQSEKDTMTYTYSSNKCTFSLLTAQTLAHTNTHTLHMQQRLTLLMSFECTSHSIHSIATLSISYAKYFPLLCLSFIIYFYFSQYPRPLFGGLYTQKSKFNHHSDKSNVCPLSRAAVSSQIIPFSIIRILQFDTLSIAMSIGFMINVRPSRDYVE